MKIEQNRFHGISLIILSAIVWGTTGVSSKLGLAHCFNIFSLSFFMMFFAMFLVVLLKLLGELGLFRKDLLVYGFFIVGGFRIAYTLSISINGA